MRSIFRENKKVIDDERMSDPIDPSDWWRYKTLDAKIDSGDKYFDHPVCKFTEFYYLLFLLTLQNEYSELKRLKKNHLFGVTVLSYDNRLKTNALAIQKSVGLPRQISQKYGHGLGEKTFLLLTSPLAGTICSNEQVWICENLGPKIVTAIRPLLYNQPQVTKLFKKAISKQGVASITAHDIKLFNLALKMIQQFGYIESIIRILKNLNLPVEENVFILNSKLFDTN